MVSGVLCAMIYGIITLRVPMLRSCAASLATLGGPQQGSKAGIQTLQMVQAEYGWTVYSVEDTSRGYKTDPVPLGALTIAVILKKLVSPARA